MEYITNADYKFAKRVCKNFARKHLGKYNDLYVQSDTILLADIFEIFRNMCIEIFQQYPAEFICVQ